MRSPVHFAMYSRAHAHEIHWMKRIKGILRAQVSELSLLCQLSSGH